MKKTINNKIRHNNRMIRFYAILSIVMLVISIISFLILSSELTPEYDTIGNLVLKSLVSGIALILSLIAGLACYAQVHEGREANKRLISRYNKTK